MLSYRHAFHAGNHADVLKHFIQVQLHQYMNQKDAAYTYIDTHSGAGVYALDSVPVDQERRIRYRHRPAVGAHRRARRR